MREEFSYNVILLGGTGAKCGEILLHMCANGYFKYKSINILYIDSDMFNGNAKKFKDLYQTYTQCRENYLIKSSPISCFFYPKVRLMTENPVKEIKNFSDMVTASGSESDFGVAEGAKALMEVLYSREEMDLEISNGFFAHPNVGAAVFAAEMGRVMSEFLSLIRIELQEMKKIKIFLLGSVFGGTGASSLPTIARYFKETLFGASDNKNVQELMKIGGCMVLPYFLFARREGKTEGEGEPVIEADKFALKTKSALEYYKYVDEEEGRKTFDELFILGHDAADVRGYYATAGAEQRNLPHIVEFYAAMSAITFFENEMDKKGHYFAVVPSDKISGENIYGEEKGYGFFFIMMRFAIVMKSLIIEELFDYTQKDKPRKTAKRIPWYYDFLNGKAKAQNFDAGRLYNYFKAITEYCDEYIRWFTELNLDNIGKRTMLDQVEYDDDRGDVVGYLAFFFKEILFRQCQNNEIWNREVDLEDETAKNQYYENLTFIRKNLEKLETIHFVTDAPSERIGMGDIWSRLSNMGFNSFVKDNEVFQNIVKSADKTMAAGVRNLVNAVFCACLF